MPQKNAIIVFAKQPIPGNTKTRLGQEIGHQTACDIYATMLQHILDMLSGIDLHRFLFLPKGEQLSASFPTQKYTLCNQADGNLGHRMEQAFHHAFGQGITKACIIGTDCPSMTLQHIQTCFDKLQEHELVLGPAKDGGYYLLGQHAPCKNIFSNIQWSTSTVLSETLTIAKNLSLSHALLPELEDIDTMSSLQNFVESKQSSIFDSFLHKIC